MSSKTRTHTARTTNTDRGDTRALRAVPESTDTATATKARTQTEDKLWEALHANPNSTAADLSSDAGIGNSTAAKILARWANDGSVTRTPGIAQDRRRVADLWSITESDAPSVTSEAAATQHAAGTDDNAETRSSGIRAQTTDTDETIADGDETDEVTAGAEPDTADPTADGKDTSDEGQQTGRRLPPGGLRGLVEDWLRDHPGEEFSPSKIGKELDRSSGAVSNALDKLVADGYAVQTQDKPKRFTAKIIPEFTQN
ncbi:MAG: MarR family transcriptional regulator [Pseudonocardiaceae bacterium]